MVDRRLSHVLILLVLIPLVQAHSESHRDDLLRDVALTVPSVAKAGLGLTVIGLGIAALPRPDTALDTATIVSGGTVSAALAVANISLIVNAWVGNPAQTRFWRRFDFGVQAAWLATGLTFLIGDAVERSAPGELLTTALPFALGLGVLMAVDTIPFSAELAQTNESQT